MIIKVEVECVYLEGLAVIQGDLCDNRDRQ